MSTEPAKAVTVSTTAIASAQMIHRVFFMVFPQIIICFLSKGTYCVFNSPHSYFTFFILSIINQS